MRPVHFFYNSLEQILFEQKRYSLKVFLEKVLREKSAPKMQCKQKHAANCNACQKPFTSEFTNNLTNYIILCTAGVDRYSYLPVVLSNKSNSGRIQERFVLRKTQEEAGLCDGIPFQHTPMCAYHSILHSLVPVQILQR